MSADTDIVDRLIRRAARICAERPTTAESLREAAAEIVRLRGEVERLSEMGGPCNWADESSCNTVPCITHPDAPHGFDRNGSHNEGRYVCECESWSPDEPPQNELPCVNWEGPAIVTAHGVIGPLPIAPAEAKGDAQSPWQSIDDLPRSDDLFWFMRWDAHGGYSTDGPRAPQFGDGEDAEDGWMWFAPCEAPAHSGPQPADGGAVAWLYRASPKDRWQSAGSRSVQVCGSNRLGSAGEWQPVYTHPPAAQVQQEVVECTCHYLAPRDCPHVPHQSCRDERTNPAGDALGVVKIDEAMVSRFWDGYHEYFDGPASRFDRERSPARDHGIHGAMAGLRAALRPSAGEGKGVDRG